jgi:hypothetical protein
MLSRGERWGSVRASGLFLCWVSAACEPVTQHRTATSAQHGDPDAPTKAAAIASPSCSPYQQLAATLTSTPTAAGCVLALPLGQGLADAPGAAVSRCLQGAPQLLVDTAVLRGQSYYRVLGADGSDGWLPAQGELLPASVVITGTEPFLGSSIDPYGTDENFVATKVSAGPASALGASVTAVWEFEGFPNVPDTQTLWLRVRTGTAEGWLSPSATGLVWRETKGGECKPPQLLQGIVRGGFLLADEARLMTHAPRFGDALSALFAPDPIIPMSWPPNIACTRPTSAYYPTAGNPAELVVFECADNENRTILWQGFGPADRAEHGAHANERGAAYQVVSNSQLRLWRVEPGPSQQPAAAANGARWIVEVTSRTADVIFRGLVLLPAQASTPASYVFLGEGGDEHGWSLLNAGATVANAAGLVRARLGYFRYASDVLEIYTRDMSTMSGREEPAWLVVHGHFRTRAQASVAAQAAQGRSPIVVRLPKANGFALGHIAAQLLQACVQRAPSYLQPRPPNRSRVPPL